MTDHAFPRTACRALAALAALALAACVDEPLITHAAAGPATPRLSTFAGATETAVVAGPASETQPAISGTRVAYTVNHDVFVYDLAAGTGVGTLVAGGPSGQIRPAISGDYVIYEDWTNGPRIRAHDLRDGTNFQLGPAGAATEYDVAASGTRVVYTRLPSNGGSSIQLHDLATRTERSIRYIPSSSTPPSGGVGEADVGGDLVVWREQWGWPTGATSIMLHDLRTGVTREIARNTSLHYSAMLKNPTTDGVRVVYEDSRDNNWDIYMFDPATGVETRITSDPADQRNADIDGNVIVWQDHRHGINNIEIYGFDLATGQEHRVTSALFHQTLPVISGNRIIWQDGRRYDSTDVYMFTLAGS